jgi:hypothetical protein
MPSRGVSLCSARLVSCAAVAGHSPPAGPRPRPAPGPNIHRRRAPTHGRASPIRRVEIRYAGDVIVIEPLSPAGEAWFDRTVPNRRSGAVRVAMRHLDDVLSRVR